ncbi:MAG: response regulator [Janthinobacterium lividum]
MTSRIFLVEDHPDIRDNLSIALEEVTGAEVVGHAQSQPEALRWLAKNTDGWDIAVLDLFLAEGSGIGVVRACGARLPHQRVVILSNYADVSANDAMAHGADAVFDKAAGLDDFFSYVLENAPD